TRTWREGWTRASRPAPSVDREVIAGLIAPRLLLAELHEDVVQERRGAEAEEVRCHPLRAEGLVEGDEVLDRLLRSPDAPSRLDPDAVARPGVHGADAPHQAESHGQRRRRAHLPRRALDEVRARRDRDQRRPSHVVVRAELTRLEDDLEMRLAARLLHAHDLV